MKAIAEQVLSKHFSTGANIARLASECDADVVNYALSKVYIYDDDSYTEILSNGQHVTGLSYEANEYTAVNEEYNYAKQPKYYEHKQPNIDKDVQPQGFSKTKDPIIRHLTAYHKAILDYCTRRYRNKLQQQAITNATKSGGSVPRIPLTTTTTRAGGNLNGVLLKSVFPHHQVSGKTSTLKSAPVATNVKLRAKGVAPLVE